MSDTPDSSVLFNTNVAELGDLMARLGQAITATETLALRDRIAVTLASAGLGWRDLAERVVAPRPARVEPLMAAPPPMPMASAWPVSEIHVEQPDSLRTPAEPLPGGRVLTNEQLSAFGYRTSSAAP